MYNIPRPTLSIYSKEEQGIKSNAMGPAATLSSDTKKCLSESLNIIDKYGYSLSSQEVLNLVGDFLKTY